MAIQLMTTADAAKKLGVTKIRLLRYLDREMVPEPRLRLGGRRIYTKTDLDKIDSVLRRRHRNNLMVLRRRRKKLMQKELARKKRAK